MREKNLIVVTILVTLGIILIILGLITGIIQAKKEAYCNSLELAEYFENKDKCKEIIER